MSDTASKERLTVRNLLPNSPAARAGVRIGDVILSVNDVPTPDFNAYIAAKSRVATQQRMDILRGNDLVQVTLELEERMGPPDYGSIVQQLEAMKEPKEPLN